MTDRRSRPPRRVVTARLATVVAVTLLGVLAQNALGSPTERPRVGLVLSGGGAKGAAHVGVIKVIERLGIPVDLVVGTSMGAIVGGLYASGLNAEELERAMRDIDWVDIFDDDPPRAERSYRRKNDDSEVLVRYRLGLSDGSIRLPQGVILGQKLGLVLRRLASRAAHAIDFDDLAVPFRAVAADLETGEAVVLDSGNLALAMRASMSVPGLFPPVEYGGRLLIDGGIANNLPVDVARAMGADVLIVVNLESRPRSRDELHSVLDVVDQTVNLLIARETRRQLDTLVEDDLLIEPELGDLGSGDFTRTAEAIALGEMAAGQTEDALHALAERTRQGSHYVVGPSPGPVAAPVISTIRIVNDTPLDNEVIAAQLRIRQGEPLDLVALEEDLSRIYGLGYFETVDYELVDRGLDSELVIVAREKAIGLDTLRFGLNLESDFEGQSAYNVVLSYERFGLNRLGAEWRGALILGEQTLFVSELYQPLDHQQRWFTDLRGAYSESGVGVFANGRRLAEFRVRQASVGLDLGHNIGSCCEVRAGVRIGRGESRLRDGAPVAPGGDFDIGQLVASAGYDTLDNARFPRDGAVLQVSYVRALGALGADDSSSQVLVGGLLARSHGRHTVIGRALVGANLDHQDEVQNLFSTGGFLSLSGFAKNEVSGENLALGGLIYYYRLGDLGAGGIEIPLYLGGSIEYGGVYDSLGDVGGPDDILAGSVLLGADTPLGPLYFAYGIAEGGNRAGYMFLGQTF